jgi:hypothetical protein
VFYLRAGRVAQLQAAELSAQAENQRVQEERSQQPQNAEAAPIANLTDFTNATGVANVTAVTNDNRTFFVQGRAIDEQGNGLAGVTISANCGAGTLRRTGTTQTDDTGRYLLRFGPGMHIKNETTGEWGVGVQAATISSAKAGYFDANLHRQGDLLMADQLPAPGADVGWKVDTNKVVLPGQPFELNFVMLPSAAIEGELRDETGTPIVGWAVCLGGEKLPPSSSVFVSVDTDANGHFSLKDVPTTGRWWLTAYSHGDPKQQIRPGPEFRSPEFNLAEPGTHNFDAQLKRTQADTPRVLNLKIPHPKQAEARGSNK